MNILENQKCKRILAVLAVLAAVSICWAEETINETTYTRTKGKGSWGTLCLPRQITAVSGATLWVPYYWQTQKESFYLRRVENSELPLAAGTPVMFLYDTSVSGTPTLTVTMTGDEMTLTDDQKQRGVYSSTTFMTGNLTSTPLSVPASYSSYVLVLGWTESKSKDEVRPVTKDGAVSISQYRAYLDLTSLPTEKPSTPEMSRSEVMAWSFDGGVTAIEEISERQDASAVSYDLSGRKVLGTVHGIVITNGKKVIR